MKLLAWIWLAQSVGESLPQPSCRLPKMILPLPSYGYSSAADLSDGNPGKAPSPPPVLVFPWLSGSLMPLRGSSLLLAACQKHGFGKWTGPVSAADRCELAQLKSPAKCSIFKQVSVSPFFFCCWKTPAACSCYHTICPWTICSQQTNCLQIICLIQDTSLKGVSTGCSGI